MDRVGADFHRTILSIAHRFQANPVAIQIPLGQEDTFQGVVDLVEEKAVVFPDGNTGIPKRAPYQKKPSRSSATIVV